LIPATPRAPLVAALALLTALGLRARLRNASAPPFDFHPTRQYYALLFAQDFRHQFCGDPRSPEARAARANREGEALLEPPGVPALTALGWCALGRESLALPRVLMSLAWALGALAAAWLTRVLGGGTLAPLLAATWCLFHPYALAAGRSAQPDRSRYCSAVRRPSARGIEPMICAFELRSRKSRADRAPSAAGMVELNALLSSSK
jgi:hypothetical protein